MSETYPLTIHLSDYALSPELIDSLAIEFYGMAIAATGDPKPNELSLEFRDSSHPILDTPIDGLNCMTSFLTAMDSYKRPADLQPPYAI